MRTLHELMNVMPQVGVIRWIGIRPGRRVPMVSVHEALAGEQTGLAGDHYAKPGGKRQVTLIQAEHLVAVASLLGIDPIAPETVRRNLVVSGINLLSFRGRRFRAGDAVLEYTGLCQPCSFMEDALGSGGYNAMRGHGGITARVIQGGGIALGGTVAPVESFSAD